MSHLLTSAAIGPVHFPDRPQDLPGPQIPVPSARGIRANRIQAERRVRAVALLPAFYTRIYALRYGEDAIEVYHDRSECRLGRLIVRDGNQESGTDGRRRCEECRKHGSG